MTERKTLTVAEVAKILGIGRRQAYDAVHRGEIPSIRLGGRYVISRRVLDDMLERGSNKAVAS